MKKLLLVLILATASMSLTNCAGVGSIVGGKIKQYTGEYKLNFGSLTKSQGKEKIKSILKQDGWDKNQETEYELKYNKQDGTVAGVGIGKVSSTYLTITFNENSMKLRMMLTGNYSYGTEDNANKIFKKIETEFNK